MTLSWRTIESSSPIDWFLTNNTQIQLKIVCNKQLNEEDQIAKIQISGRIVGCLPLQLELFTNEEQMTENRYYQQLWNRMEQKTFHMFEVRCTEKEFLQVHKYIKIMPPKSSSNNVVKFRVEDAKVHYDIFTEIENGLWTWDDG